MPNALTSVLLIGITTFVLGVCVAQAYADAAYRTSWIIAALIAFLGVLALLAMRVAETPEERARRVADLSNGRRGL